MKKHFVQFFSPGTFMAEQSIREIESWDIEKAREMAESIEVRYGAVPYGFQFFTKSRGPDDLDSTVTDRSSMHYLPHCKVETLEELEQRADPKESILRSNMRCNGWDRVVTTTKGWKWTQPLDPNDVVLA